MAANEPVPKIGLCEHGRVRTLCAACRQVILEAQPAQASLPRPRAQPYRRPMKDQPEARVTCAECPAIGTARGFVEDLDSRRFLCRTHAAARTYAHVTYTTSGRVVEAQAPSPAHWKDMLRDSRATSIRGSSRPAASTGSKSA